MQKFYKILFNYMLFTLQPKNIHYYEMFMFNKSCF